MREVHQMDFYIYNKKGKTYFKMDEVNNTMEVLNIDYSNPAKAIEQLMQIHSIWKAAPDSDTIKKYITSDTFVDYEDLEKLSKFFKRIGSVITARRALERALENALEDEDIECCDPSIDLGDLILLDAQGNTVKVNKNQFSDFKKYLDFIYDQNWKFDEFCEQLGEMYEEMSYKYDEYVANQE